MAAKKNDTYDAFVLFLEENQNSFYRLAYRYVQNSDTALDMVHEAVVKAISKLDTLRDTALMKPWFYRILVNEALGFLRQNKKVILTEEIPEGTQTSNRDIAQNLDLYHAIDSLSPKLKTIIILRYFEDMKLEDIALVTHTNLSTVKTRLYRALKALKPMMQESA